MIFVPAGQQFVHGISPLPTGLLGILTYELYDPISGAIAIPETSVGITSPNDGTYVFTGIAPTPSVDTTYFGRFNDHSTPDGIWEEEVQVNATGLPPDLLAAGLSYASLDDLREMYPELVQRADTELLPALQKAERDIDEYAGFVPVLDNGRKFDLDPVTGGLDPAQAQAITRATCAQARFRIYMGPTYFVEEVGYSEVGGDIPVKKPPRYGPEMRMEFPAVLRKLTGRLA